MQHIASISWYHTMPFLTSPLQNPTLGEYRPSPPKARPEASCRRLRDTEVVIVLSQTIPSRPFEVPGSAPTYVCVSPAWGSAGGDCLIPRFLWHLQADDLRALIVEAARTSETSVDNYFRHTRRHENLKSHKYY
jgi:hypothetical protein